MCTDKTVNFHAKCLIYIDTFRGVSLGIGLRYLIPYYDVILSTEVMWSRGFRNSVKHLSEWGFQKVYGEALMLEIGFRKKSDDQARSRLLMR